MSTAIAKSSPSTIAKPPPPSAKPEPQAAPPAAAEPGETLRDYLFKNRDRIDQEASVYLRGNKLIESLISVAALIVHKDPKKKLQLCTKASVLESIRECARLGLRLGGSKPQGYLIPYGTVCSFQVSYFGQIAMMRRSGEVTDVRAHVVHKGDAFDYEQGLNPWITHKPHTGDHAVGAWTHVYSVIKIKGAVDPLIEVMTKGEVMLIKGRSKASGDGPWVTDEEWMALKTVLRRGSKLAPMPEDLEMQLAAEDAIAAVVIDRREVPRGSDGLEMALAKAQPALTEGAPKETIEPAHDKDGVVIETKAQHEVMPGGARDRGDGVLVDTRGEPL